MTDETIIDGIDVSKCENHTNCGICCIAHITFESCKSKPDCYYKQLKRKEQECEELKHTISEQSKIIENFNNEIIWRQETLDEIEEIANRKCGYCSTPKCPRMDNILNLINKVKEK